MLWENIKPGEKEFADCGMLSREVEFSLVNIWVLAFIFSARKLVKPYDPKKQLHLHGSFHMRQRL